MECYVLTRDEFDGDFVRKIEGGTFAASTRGKKPVPIAESFCVVFVLLFVINRILVFLFRKKQVRRTKND